MCGIGGALAVADAGGGVPSAHSMLSVLKHRGPDEFGVFEEPGVALAHTRLSIIAPGNSKQPMLSRSGRYVMVFNGEIFNYRELRRQLSGPWSTDGDTEVLLALYERFGPDSVTRLRGQFAFAVYDRFKPS